MTERTNGRGEKRFPRRAHNPETAGSTPASATINWPIVVLCLIGVMAFWCAVAWLFFDVPASRTPILGAFGLLLLALLAVWFDGQYVRNVGRQTRRLRWDEDE